MRYTGNNNIETVEAAYLQTEHSNMINQLLNKEFQIIMHWVIQRGYESMMHIRYSLNCFDEITDLLHDN